MNISEHDLRQLDAASLHALRNRDQDALERLARHLMEDLKEARERLNQNPKNSSRPPSTVDPWSRNSEDTEQDPPTKPAKKDVESGEPETRDPKVQDDGKKKKKPSTEPRKPGKQKGTPGHARTQTLPVTATEHHHPENCILCGTDLLPEKATCYTGFETVNVELGEADQPGLHLTNTRHLYYQNQCSCGHLNRCEPYRAPPEGGDWGKVTISEWRLIDSGLAALLLILHFRMRMSVRYCREFMMEIFALSLSDGAILQSLHESARATAPAAEQVQQEVQESDLAYSDETPHHEAKNFLWLWVIANSYTVFFFIGRRTKELFLGKIGQEFAGWLMSDGYGVYRHHALRLRCWAHLIRKARGLAETFTPHVQGYGVTILEIFDRLIEAVHKAREGPPIKLFPILMKDLNQLLQLCEKMSASKNEKAAKLGREFLNDWEAIFRVIDHPHLPLTNNFAERLLRHWVILRRITQGTRTPVGSLALSTVASVIETCRLRKASPLRYLQLVIAASRKGLEVPPLPTVPATS